MEQIESPTAMSKMFRHEHATSTEEERVFGAEATAQKFWAAFRILFGVIFLFDGILKWYLLASNQMQGIIDGMGGMIYYTPAWLTTNWFLFAVMVGLGETLGGVFLLLGIFQKPAALWSAFVCLSIWAFGGFGGYPSAIGSSWSTAGYTDPGGDLMLALVYLFIFAVATWGENRYSLSARLRLRERFISGTGTLAKLGRFIVL